MPRILVHPGMLCLRTIGHCPLGTPLFDYRSLTVPALPLASLVLLLRLPPLRHRQ
ncbi:MAG: hypothetical protein HQL89_02115 [Magnetococcales bacterium]|nr:hypothetical protein [Magnetococcales bacterium]